MDLSAVPTEELRVELSRRGPRGGAYVLAEQREMIRARYGVCPQCGSDLRSVSCTAGQEFWSNPEWRLPMPPPPGSGQMDGVEYIIAFECEQHHTWEKREQHWFDKPIKGAF